MTDDKRVPRDTEWECRVSPAMRRETWRTPQHHRQSACHLDASLAMEASRIVSWETNLRPSGDRERQAFKAFTSAYWSRLRVRPHGICICFDLDGAQ